MSPSSRIPSHMYGTGPGSLSAQAPVLPPVPNAEGADPSGSSTAAETEGAGHLYGTRL
jgi:hypothetical protein